jgi:DNA-binding beta-propeller fold protein YncE
MKLPIGVAAILAVGSLSVAMYAQNASSGSLLVLSKKDHTLAVVDPATLKVLGKAPVGNDPHEVIASSDGTTAYVSNYGSGAFNTLAVIDVGGKTWFTAEGAKAIGRYDPATRKVDWILGTGQNRTHMIYVSDDMQQIVTTNVSSGTVTIMDLQEVRMGPPPGAPGMPPPGGMPPGGPGGPGGPGSPPRKDWNETVVPVGGGSEGFDISPDKKEVWVANSQDGTISVIDLPRKKVVETLQANVRGANRLRFTPDGKLVLVSMLSGGDLVILDASTRKEVKRVPIGQGAAGIEMQPDGLRAFVACTPDNYVAVIDLHLLTVVGHIDAGGNPDGMTWVVRK